MSRKLIQITFSILLLGGMVLGFAIKDGALAQNSPDAKIDADLASQLASGPADFIVMMSEQADLSAAKQLQTKVEKGQYVFDTLVATSARTQADLRTLLDSQGVEYRPFYIVNAVWVKAGTLDLAQTIAGHADVAAINTNHTYQLDEPINLQLTTAQPQGVESNISFIKAPEAWAMGVTGEGTVVAGNDTGLNWSHPAIAPHYRGCLNPPECTDVDHNYNWYDVYAPQNVDPWDDYGHGTHTTGTMVGDDGQGNQIGVAPGATTIHCKNMQSGGGDDAHFIECFEWDLAPWDLTGANPRPDLAPDAINNSWGIPYGGDNNMREAVDNLLAAGIIVEVSAGNEGSGCQSLRSPGDYLETFTTGSVNHANPFPGTVTGFSSRGPSALDGNYFPDFMAPGENVRSVWGNDYGYASGTSMAGPHVTALIGLIWSANPALRGQVDLTYQVIQDTVVPLTGQNGSCGGDYNVGPNNDWGYGTIDALAAVQAAIAMGGAGQLDGTVTDAVTGAPIEGAKVLAVSDEGFSRATNTDVTGFYTMTVASGLFDVTASDVKSESSTVSGVEVITDTLTTQDFELVPRGKLTGHVTDYDNGFGLVGATVTAADGTTTTTDDDGYYELYLDEGTQDVTASMPDYAEVTESVVMVSGETTVQDFALQAAVVFIPSPLEVTVDLESTASVDASILNRQDFDYAFKFQEKDGGMTPLGGELVKVDIKGTTITPDASTASATGFTPRPDQTIYVTRHNSVNEANVLLVAADYDSVYGSPIQQLLQAYGDLGAVDYFDAQYGTPTLEELEAYNVVVTWSNYQYSDPNGIGNVLADYVDNGGKVINLMFAIGTHGWQMGGRFMSENYTAFNGTSISGINACLGDYDPTHPIMDGVTNVCDVYRVSGTYLTPGSTAVANWSDGLIFVAAKDDGTVVSIGGYVGYAYQWTGQMADVLHNAINFISVPPDVLWLGEDPAAGTVPAEDTYLQRSTSQPRRQWESTNRVNSWLL